MIFLGIDPGGSGAVAAIDGLGKIQRVVKNSGTERDVFEAFCGWDGEDVLAVIEQVHSMPKQGVASSFRFGVSYGFLRGCLVAAGMRFVEVSPVKWQTAMKCRTRGDKNVSKTRAQQLFPGIGITHATADALLLAEYARLHVFVDRTSPAGGSAIPTAPPEPESPAQADGSMLACLFGVCPGVPASGQSRAAQAPAAEDPEPS